MEDQSIQDVKKLGVRPEETPPPPSDRTFWTIEVRVEIEQTKEVKVFRYQNQSGAQLMKFREVYMTAGVMVPVDETNTDHYILLHPFDIKQIDIWRQKKYFERR